MTVQDYFKETIGYELMTTAYQDLSIAERFGESAIIDTVKRLYKEFKDNYKLVVELVLVLNHKIWHTYKTKPVLANLYDYLWKRYDSICRHKHLLTSDAKKYYYEVLD